MPAFGTGTLPSMLDMSLAAPALASVLSDRWTRRPLGVALVLLALLSVVPILYVTVGSHQQHT